MMVLECRAPFLMSSRMLSYRAMVSSTFFWSQTPETGYVYDHLGIVEDNGVSIMSKGGENGPPVPAGPERTAPGPLRSAAPPRRRPVRCPGWTGRPVQARISDRIAAPLTYGVLYPVILLPARMDWEDRETLSCVLSHEHTLHQPVDAGAWVQEAEPSSRYA